MSHISRREWLIATGAAVAGAALTKHGLGSPNAGAASTAGVPQPVVDTLVFVPGGFFQRGTTAAVADQLAAQFGYHPSWFAGEVPAELVDVPPFLIRKYPVTCAEYAVFCTVTGHPLPKGWVNGQMPFGQHAHPVSGVMRADAEAFAAWRGMRLPTELEWEKAARGVDGRMFPWGDVFDPSACRFGVDPAASGPKTSSVFAHPSGASPFGVMDTIGNVAEYCADGPDSNDGWIKGGAWISTEIVNLRCAARNMSGAIVNPSAFYGFRCVKDVA